MTAEERSKLANDIQASAAIRERLAERLLNGSGFDQFFLLWREIEAFDVLIAAQIKALRPN
jgi:hypothetical protein